MNKKKLSALLVAGTLTVGVVGGTFAWFTSQDTVTNEFSTGGTTDQDDDKDAGIEIVEEFKKPTNVLPGDETNKDVQVKNTSTYDQFIRVKFTKQFVQVNADGEKEVITTDPVSGKALDTNLIELNFTSHLQDNINLDNTGTWFEAEDGYYYYVGKVDQGSWTNTLLDSVTLSSNAGNEYKNLEFDVTVVADSIQASNEAYKDWCYSSLVDIYEGLEGNGITAPSDNMEPNTDDGHEHKVTP